MRAALARLTAAGLLQIVPTYVPGTTDTAHTLSLPAELTVRDGDSGGIAVSLTAPSSPCRPWRGGPFRAENGVAGRPPTSLLLGR